MDFEEATELEEQAVEPSPETPAPRTARSSVYAMGVARKKVVQRTKDDCDCGLDDYGRAAIKDLEPVAGRMNVLTHKACLPCDFVSLTRTCSALDEIELGMRAVHAELGRMLGIEQPTASTTTSATTTITSAGAARVPEPEIESEDTIIDDDDSPPPIRIEMAPDKIFGPSWEAVNALERGIEPKHKTLARHVSLLEHDNTWLELQSSGTALSTGLRYVSGLIKAMRFGSTPMRAMLKTRKELRDIQSKLRNQMYPTTVEHIKELLRVHDVLPNNEALPMARNEVACGLCQNSLDEATVVHIQPRCTEHLDCITERRHGHACKCTSNKVAHLTCLANAMLREYRGDDNEGVGRAKLRCPYCRGSYCFNDLICMRVVEPAAPPLCVHAILPLLAHGSSERKRSAETTVGDSKPEKRMASALETSRDRLFASHDRFNAAVRALQRADPAFAEHSVDETVVVDDDIEE